MEKFSNSITIGIGDFTCGRAYSSASYYLNNYQLILNFPVMPMSNDEHFTSTDEAAEYT